MKMTILKAASVLRIVRPVLFVFLFLISAFAAYSIDQTNRLDFDGDGKADIAVYREGGNDRSTQIYSQSNWYYLGSLTGGVFSSFQYGQTLDIPIPADYVGDNRTDFAAFRWFFSEDPPYDNNVIFITGYSAGSTSTSPDISLTRGFGNAGGRKMARNFPEESSGSKAKIGEFQRINMSLPQTEARYKYTFYYQTVTGGLVAKDTNFPLPPNNPWGTYEQVPVPEDYDGDGISEIAVFDVTNRCYRVWEWVKDPVTNKVTSEPKQDPLPESCFDIGFTTPAPGDYDKDGKIDYAAVKITGSTIEWKIKPSGGGTDFGYSFPLASSNSLIKPVVADYDGDERADLAFAQVINGNWQWTIRKSNCFTKPSGIDPCGSSVPTMFNTTFGLGTDTLLASPYFYDRWY